MADKKISELVSLAGKDVAATDFFPVVDVSVTETKSLTRDELRNAVNAIQFAATKALATTAAASLPDDTIIEVAADESLSGARTRYTVAAGALVFAVNLDQLQFDLADASDPAKGAALVGYDGGDAQAVLDSAKPMQSYAELRLYAGRATGIRITNHGVAGFFQHDAADATSADNGGTIIVSSNGKRWKRVFDGAVNAKWFGALGDGSGALASANFIANANAYYATSGALYLQEPRFKAGFDTQDFVALQLAIDVASATVRRLLIPAGDYIITKCLMVKRSGLSIQGEGKLTTLIRQSASVGWLAEFSDDSQMLVGGKVYGSANYGTGKAWSTTGVHEADDFRMEGVGIVGDMTGFAAGGWYMAGSGAAAPALQATQLSQSGVQAQGELTRFSKNIRLQGCYFTGHAECGIEPTYVDGLVIEGNYATLNGWQFIGTDHAIRNVQIINNYGFEPATGNSESAFLDLEEGQGADFENIIVSGNLHIATVSGFVKVHPRETSGMATGCNIRGLVISDNVSISGGAATLGFYGQYWTGADTAFVYGNVTNVTITGNVIKGYTGNIFRIGSSDTGSGKAQGIVVANNYIESAAGASVNSSAFDLPKLVEGCEIVNNVVRLKGAQQFFARISWQSASDTGKVCKNIRIAGNDVELKAPPYMIDFAQVDNLVIDGNRFDASGTVLAAGGGFLGAQPGAAKSNIYVRNNKITLYQRNFILTFYQRVTNLVVENNHIVATAPDTTSRYLFALNQQVTRAVIRNNRIEAGNAPVLMLGDGVGTSDATLKCDNFIFVGNDVTHSCAGNAFEVRQCVGFDFCDNRITATAGGSGLVVPVYSGTSFLLLQGAITVSNNKFIGLGSSTNRIGIRLSFRQGGAQDVALVTGNLVQAASGGYVSSPIVVEGNPRTVGVYSNILHGVENAASRYGITVTGSTATPKIEAAIVGNLTHGGASTLAVDAATNVNVTNVGNHLSTAY